MNLRDLGLGNGGNGGSTQYEVNKKRLTKAIAWGVGGLVGIIILFNANTRVDPGYAGVQYNLFTGIQEETLPEGLRWHAPWINVYEYPVSTENVKLKGKSALQINTGDGKTVEADVSYAFRFENEKLSHVFKRFRRQSAEEIADGYMKTMLLDNTQNVSTKHSVLEVYSQEREAISKEIRQKLTDLFAKDGIVLEQFAIVDVRPDKETKKILARISEAEATKEAIIRERANVEEQNKNIEQQNKNDKLAAEGQKQVAIVNAQKAAETIRIEAEAQAKANQDLAKSMTPALVQYEYIKAWKAGGSQVPKINGGSGSILNVPADILADDKKEE
jgi:regulator of protease activity HflC (stomatin/prohibitin superfamily)